MQINPWLTKAQARIQKEPTAFYDHALGCTHWSKQDEITMSAFTNPRTTVPSCHASGKSYTMARLSMAFLFAYTDSIVITTAPTWRQVENVIWREMRGAHASAKMRLGGKMLQTRLDLGPNWYAIGISSDKPDKVQGFHAKSGHILIIVDEAAGVGDDILQAIEGMLTSKDVHLVYVGNATNGSGPFYESAKSEFFHKIKISVFDTPNFKINGLETVEDLKRFETYAEVEALPLAYPQLVTPAWAWMRMKNWGEDSPIFKGRVLAEFPTEGNDTLIGLSAVERAQEKEWTPEEMLTWPRRNVLGVDVARFGRDHTSMIAMNNYKQVGHRRHNKKDLMETCGLIIEFFKELGFSKSLDMIAIDDTGLGGGVTDRLVELGYNVMPVNFGAGPTQPEDKDFFNLKAEIYKHLQDLFRNNEISIMDSGKLLAQVPTIRYGFMSDGRMLIVSKKDMKDEGVESPDDADALAIACWGVRCGAQVTADPSKGRGGTIAGNIYRKQF